MPLIPSMGGPAAPMGGFGASAAPPDPLAALQAAILGLLLSQMNDQRAELEPPPEVGGELVGF